MFSYYGSKSKLVKKYDPPAYEKIIEPFAGSARYALHYFEKQVLLCDLDKRIVGVWKWLQQCNPKDVLGLPEFKKGDDILAHKLSPDEYEFLRLLLQPGTVGGNKACEWGARDYPRNRKKVAESLFKIKHWEIRHSDFLSLENTKATWFVDPPYQFGGHKYKCSNKNIDYDLLRVWIETREGQVIACENSQATWMKFKPLSEMQGIRHRTTESVWTNDPMNDPCF